MVSRIHKTNQLVPKLMAIGLLISLWLPTNLLADSNFRVPVSFKTSDGQLVTDATWRNFKCTGSNQFGEAFCKSLQNYTLVNDGVANLDGVLTAGPQDNFGVIIDGGELIAHQRNDIVPITTVTITYNQGKTAVKPEVYSLPAGVFLTKEEYDANQAKNGPASNTIDRGTGELNLRGIIGDPEFVDFSVVGRVTERITGWAVGLAGAIALIFLIWGGITYLTSAGNSDQAGKAKNTITWAIIGLIVVISAYAIVRYVAITFIINSPIK